jgi:cysteinyl-tRNA synthetase
MMPHQLPTRLIWIGLALAGVCSLWTFAAPSPADPAIRQAQATQSSGLAAERARRMAAVSNWGYWLSSATMGGVAAAPHDLLVVDSEISLNREFQREYSREEVARMKRRPDGSPRVLLAYLSIGEAERYRPYWQPDWYDQTKRPAWLDKENSRWAGNYLVRYWDPEWQRLIFGEPESYLDRIVAQGFDGVYLDRADAYSQWRKENRSAQAEMVTFITRLSEHARKTKPEFLVIMQNAEELLEDKTLFATLDGIAKEDLLFGVRRAQEPNKPKEVEWSIELLRMAREGSRKVLVVEYLKDPTKMAEAAVRLLDEGFVPYFAPRKLHCLNPPAVLDASGKLPEHNCR